MALGAVPFDLRKSYAFPIAGYYRIGSCASKEYSHSRSRYYSGLLTLSSDLRPWTLDTLDFGLGLNPSDSRLYTLPSPRRAGVHFSGL